MERANVNYQPADLISQQKSFSFLSHFRPRVNGSNQGLNRFKEKQKKLDLKGYKHIQYIIVYINICTSKLKMNTKKRSPRSGSTLKKKKEIEKERNI